VPLLALGAKDRAVLDSPTFRNFGYIYFDQSGVIACYASSFNRRDRLGDIS